jgi:hypothetical protein
MATQGRPPPFERRHVAGHTHMPQAGGSGVQCQNMQGPEVYMLMSNS